MPHPTLAGGQFDIYCTARMAAVDLTDEAQKVIERNVRVWYPASSTELCNSEPGIDELDTNE